MWFDEPLKNSAPQFFKGKTLNFSAESLQNLSFVIDLHLKK